MNRLILVGNGFDLAHKLKTSYCDFVSDYLSQAINIFFTENNYSDPLLSIRFNYASQTISNPPLSTPSTSFELLHTLKAHHTVKVKVKSKLLDNTLNIMKNVNWVDLENIYFNQLLMCRDKETFVLSQVAQTNQEFEYLKLKLEIYLDKAVQAKAENAYSEEIALIFRDIIDGSDIITKRVGNQYPKKLMVLNFNYTDTVEKYLEPPSMMSRSTINYIHGQLNSKENPIIFGFGDEYNKHYLQFEDLESRDLMRHIKSFGYFKTSNYQNLTRFLEADDFQVFVLGHSLGLSDRTMLKQIFEHNNCQSVKIYYYKRPDGTDDYFEKTIDISSHFTDKGRMRNIVVPYNKSSPMPQPDIKP